MELELMGGHLEPVPLSSQFVTFHVPIGNPWSLKPLPQDLPLELVLQYGPVAGYAC